MQSRHALIVERDFSTNENVENDSKAPDVDLGTGVRFSVEELRCGEVERSAERVEMRRRGVEVRETKVDNLDVARFRDEDVLNLQICS